MGRYYAKSASTVIASKSLHSQHDISLEHLVPKKKKDQAGYDSQSGCCFKLFDGGDPYPRVPAWVMCFAISQFLCILTTIFMRVSVF